MNELKDTLVRKVNDIMDLIEDDSPLETNFPAEATASFEMDGHRYGVTIEVRVKKLQ